MKILRVGDYHIQVSNLEDCQKLLDFVIKIAKKEKAEIIELMGDTFHNHAVKRIEVEYFVKNALKELSKIAQVIVLVGNHDMVIGKSKHAGKHALEPFKEMENITIVDTPMVINNIGYLPYMQDNRQISLASEELYKKGAKEVLVGHLTVDGAKYENGFYSEEGIDMDLISQKEIISGHVHKQGQVGKCFYVGTPKWDTMNSAGLEKGIWLFNHLKTGKVRSKKFYSTEEVVTPIYKLEMDESNEKEIEIPKRGIIYLTAKGKSAWLKKIRKKYADKVRFKGIPTDKKITQKNKEGKVTDFSTFLDEVFEPSKGVKKEDILNYIREV